MASGSDRSLLECTNLPPYAVDVKAVTGLPVFDIVTLARTVYATASVARQGAGQVV